MDTKKLLKYALAVCPVLCLLCACAAAPEPTTEPAAIPITTPTTQPITEAATAPTTVPATEAATEPTEPEKQLLELFHRLDVDFTAGQERTQETVSIPFPLKSDLDWTPIRELDSGAAQAMIDHISEIYPTFISENWQCYVNYFDAEKTTGMVSFRYLIGEDILTNKGITCSISDGKISVIYYTNMSCQVEEAEILARIARFESEYTQEKRELQENEEFIREDVVYTYNYNLGKLIYTYNLFYYQDFDGIKVINNETGSEYFVE